MQGQPQPQQPKTVFIDEKEYAIADLPEEAIGALQLMQINSQKIQQAQLEITLAQASNEGLGGRLSAAVKGVKPLPKPRAPRVNTGKGGNRKTRRAAAKKAAND